MSFKAIIFDLDGTLLDTLADLANAVNRTLTQNGFPIHPVDAYRYFVGNGARKLVQRALPEAVRDETTIDSCYQEFMADYRTHWNVETHPYAGIRELLNELSIKEIPLCILSNKPHPFTLECVNYYLSDCVFKIVFGQRPDVPKKPDPAGALEIADMLNLRPAECLVVGDSGVDMQTATAAGMFPLGVLWGFRPEHELKQFGAGKLIHHPKDLIQFLNHAKQGENR